MGFRYLDDSFEAGFAVGDYQVGGDLVAGLEGFDLLGVGDHIAHGHGGHEAGNVAVFDDDDLVLRFGGNYLGLDGVVFFWSGCSASRGDEAAERRD